MIQQSVEALIKGFNGHQRVLEISNFTMVVLLVAMVVKLALWYVCAKIASHSPSADALAQVPWASSSSRPVNLDARLTLSSRVYEHNQP